MDLEFELLPDDLKKNYIVNFLEVEEILKLCETNSEYYEVCKDNKIWKRLIYRDFNIEIHKNILKEFHILGKESYYEIYIYIYEISKFETNSIKIIIDLFLKKKNFILFLLSRITMKSSIEDLLKLERIDEDILVDIKDNYIYQSNLTEDEMNDLAYEIRELTERRIYVHTMSEINKNGKILLKKLYQTENKDIQKQINNKLTTIDSDIYDYLNSHTISSFWYLIYLLTMYSYDILFYYKLKRLLTIETKLYFTKYIDYLK